MSETMPIGTHCDVIALLILCCPRSQYRVYDPVPPPALERLSLLTPAMSTLLTRAPGLIGGLVVDVDPLLEVCACVRGGAFVKLWLRRSGADA